MTITVRGTLDGFPVRGEVADGVIRGSRPLVARVEAMVAGGVHVGLGPWAGPAQLDDIGMTRITLASAVDPGSARIDGPVAPVEPIPAGAES